MEISLKHCKTSRGEDIFSNLPDELLIRIMSLLTTKDAYRMSLLSNSIRRILPWLTSLDFDDSPTITYFFDRPNHIKLFPAFKRFVDTALQSSLCQNLIRFRLRFNEIKVNNIYTRRDKIFDGCSPDVHNTHVHKWICFPLTRNVRELDLCFNVRNAITLPPSLFTNEILEVLKLDTDVQIDLTMPSFHLPNLKLLHLKLVTFTRDDFVTRLISSCPSLKDLKVEAWWQNANDINISSVSLQRLELYIYRINVHRSSQTVLIDTPNLQRLSLSDNLAYSYSIINTNTTLVEVLFDMRYNLIREGWERSVQALLPFVRFTSNVKHLSLTGLACKKVLDQTNNLEDQLPVFYNLKYLELGFCVKEDNWNKVLLGFLNRAPFLETLVFPVGLYHGYHYSPLISNLDTVHFSTEAAELESQGWNSTQAIPSCCNLHLRRIVAKCYLGIDRELELVKFFLKISLVLDELLVVCLKDRPCGSRPLEADKRLLESKLQQLPRASSTCSIRVE